MSVLPALYGCSIARLAPIRVIQALWLPCTGARGAAFCNIKIIAECLADELISASKHSSHSSTIFCQSGACV